MPKYFVQKIPAGNNRFFKGGKSIRWTNDLDKARQYRTKRAALVAATLIEKNAASGIKTAIYTKVD
jgi:hypothetical protein